MNVYQVYWSYHKETSKTFKIQPLSSKNLRQTFISSIEYRLGVGNKVHICLLIAPEIGHLVQSPPQAS